jgi:transposase, IS5 family
MGIFGDTNKYMRKRFETQLTLGLTPIAEVVFAKNRDELAPTLAALKHIFVTPSLNEQVFAIVEEKIASGSKNFKGREGMTLWQILVLATCRLTLDADYDRMWDFANHHSLIRKIMQVSSNSFTGEDPSFGLQTIKDNLMLLDEETVMKINELVVAEAHEFVLKKNEKLVIKSDTYVLETNVHFPTDYNLLLDASRKCLDVMQFCKRAHGFEGWRKLQSWRSELKSMSRALGKACSGTGKNKAKAIESAANQYLLQARKLYQKIDQSVIENIERIVKDKKLEDLIENDLVFFMSMLKKHIDLVERRLIKSETIPTEEKVYSIFELHTEWISKGKVNKSVELGHNMLISSDQFGFILRWRVIEKQHDSALVIALADDLLHKYKDRIRAMSFDKGFYSQENKALLALVIPQVIMPKKGNKNVKEKEEEPSKSFKKLRYAHSAVESNINQLEHHGLNRCPDKGLHRFKTYAALGVLSYNLNKLGRILLENEVKSVVRQAA